MRRELIFLASLAIFLLLIVIALRSRNSTKQGFSANILGAAQNTSAVFSFATTHYDDY